MTYTKLYIHRSLIFPCASWPHVLIYLTENNYTKTCWIRNHLYLSSFCYTQAGVVFNFIRKYLTLMVDEKAARIFPHRSETYTYFIRNSQITIRDRNNYKSAFKWQQSWGDGIWGELALPSPLHLVKHSILKQQQVRQLEDFFLIWTFFIRFTKFGPTFILGNPE